MSLTRFTRRAIAIAAGAAATCAALVPQAAFAWGHHGHDIVVDLAYQRLTPAARAQVDKLLSYAPQQGTPGCPVGDLHKASEWADCMRANSPDVEKAMHLHHTDRIPLCGPADPAQFCSGGKCAAGDIERELPILSNRGANPIDRLHALEAVIHLVGDEHQPIHAVATAASQGNPVSYPGQKKPGNLHSMWDDYLVDVAVPKTPAGLAMLNADITRNGGGWASGSPMSWALEANQVARTQAFAQLPAPQSCGVSPPGETQNLSPAYIQAMIPVVRTQLEKAGVRLAAVLNRALG